MSPETIDALVAAGVTAEQLAAAIKAEIKADEDRIAARRAKAAEKKRRQRSAVVPACPGDIEGHNGTDGDNPRPLPPSPQTPQPPTPTPGEQSRARKGRPLAKLEPDLTERIWQAASKTSRDRSGRPALGKAVLAAIRLGATDEALQASVRDHCRAQGDFAKGVHLVVAGEHWRDHLGGASRQTKDGPVEPAVQARRLRHWRDTGSWEPGWGEKPDRPANDAPAPLAQDTAA